MNAENADSVQAAVDATAAAGVKGFVDEMRAQGIHVGLGDPARCVTCGEAWPCEATQ